VRFGSLDFFVTMEEELVWAPAPVQPPRFADFDTVIEALEELQLCAPEVLASESD
jgi:hypothetical protein